MNKTKIFLTVMTMMVFAIQTSSSLFAQSTDSSNIVGSWLVNTTPTGAPPFKALLTFAEGGVVIASAQGDILLTPPPGVPPLATAAHGAWVRTSNREYLFTFRQLLYNADGTYAGAIKVRSTASLNKDGAQWDGHLVADIYNANDEVIFTITDTELATRIVVEPLTP